MNWLREFREFAVKGNVLDLAVAVIIGGAFGVLIGGFDFKNLFLQVGAAKIGYGKFIQSGVDFLIIAAAIFLAVKLINRFRQKAEEKAPASPPRQEQLLEEIRDLLKTRH